MISELSENDNDSELLSKLLDDSDISEYEKVLSKIGVDPQNVSANLKRNVMSRIQEFKQNNSLSFVNQSFQN